MGTYNPNYMSTDNLLRGLRGLTGTVRIGVISYEFPEPPSSLGNLKFFIEKAKRRGR